MRFRNRYNPNSPKPKREYSVGWLTDELDRLTSLIIRARHPRCVLCDSVVDLENGHLLTRTWRPTRWDISPTGNCHTLCHRDNMEHEGKPEKYTLWYIGRFGRAAYEELRQRAASHQKFTYETLLEMHEERKNVWSGLKKAA